MNTLTPEQFAALPPAAQYELYRRADLRAHNAEFLLAEHLHRLDLQTARAQNIGVLTPGTGTARPTCTKAA